MNNWIKSVMTLKFKESPNGWSKVNKKYKVAAIWLIKISYFQLFLHFYCSELFPHAEIHIWHFLFSFKIIYSHAKKIDNVQLVFRYVTFCCSCCLTLSFTFWRSSLRKRVKYFTTAARLDPGDFCRLDTLKISPIINNKR